MIAATDSAAHAACVQAAAASEGVQVPVLIEVDVGMKRCGIAPGEAVLRLAELISASPNLCFLGVMGWEGHTLAFSGDAKQEQVAGSIAKLTQSAELCRAAGIPVEIVSSSGQRYVSGLRSPARPHRGAGWWWSFLGFEL